MVPPTTGSARAVCNFVLLRRPGAGLRRALPSGRRPRQSAPQPMPLGVVDRCDERGPLIVRPSCKRQHELGEGGPREVLSTAWAVPLRFHFRSLSLTAWRSAHGPGDATVADTPTGSPTSPSGRIGPRARVVRGVWPGLLRLHRPAAVSRARLRVVDGGARSRARKVVVTALAGQAEEVVHLLPAASERSRCGSAADAHARMQSQHPQLAIRCYGCVGGRSVRRWPWRW